MNEKLLNRIESRLMMRAKRHGTELSDEANSPSEKLVAEYLMDIHTKRLELLEKLKGEITHATKNTKNIRTNK